MVVETAIEAVNGARDRRCRLQYAPKAFMGPKTGPGVQAIRDKADNRDSNPARVRLRPGGSRPGGRPRGSSQRTRKAVAIEPSPFSFDRAVRRPANTCGERARG